MVINRKSWSVILFASALLAGLGRMLLSADWDEYLDGLKVRYGFANWVGRTETNYSCLVTNWVPNAVWRGVTNLTLIDEATSEGGSKERIYSFSPTNAADTDIELKVYVGMSVADAHSAMMDAFGNCSASHPFPLGTVKVGDRCYFGYPTNAYNGIWFVRNNVFVRVFADNTNCSVRAFVEDIDTQLKAISNRRQ